MKICPITIPALDLRINPIAQLDGKHRRTTGFYCAYAAVEMRGGAPVVVAEARFYHTRTCTYCCIWVRMPDYSMPSASYRSSALGTNRQADAFAMAASRLLKDGRREFIEAFRYDEEEIPSGMAAIAVAAGAKAENLFIIKSFE